LGCSLKEKEQLAHSMENVNDYYPKIVKFHRQELMSYFDALNTDYVIRRKERLNAVRTREDALEYIKEVKASFKACLGEMPAKNEGVNAKVVDTLDKGDFYIDKVLIESLPGYFLTANYYYPKNISKKCPAILHLLGHSQNGKAFHVYVAFCVEAVLNGFCVLTFDPLGQGERKMYSEKDAPIFAARNPDHVHFLLGQQISLTGDNVTKYMMWDNVRALDYLCSRPEVDTDRIAVAGNSGGGHMSAFMGVYDDRPKVIGPSSYITEMRSLAYHVGVQETEQSMPGFMKAGLNQADLVIAAAPKPYFINAALMDFFPIEGTREAYIEAKRIYKILGAEENLDMYISPKPHGFWHDARENLLRFICRHLNVEYIEDKKIDYDNLPTEEELQCLEDGDINSCNTTTLQRINRERAESLYPKEKDINGIEEYNAYREHIREKAVEMLGIQYELLQWNHEVLKKETLQLSQCGNSPGCSITVTDMALFPEKYMRIYCTLYEKESKSCDKVLVHVGAADDMNVIGELLSRYDAVLCVETRGTGRTAMEPGSWFFRPDDIFNEEATYNCNADMLGRSVQGMRVMDVMSALKLLQELRGVKASDVTLYGEEEDAITALYTAVLTGIGRVWLKRLLYSYKSIINNRFFNWKPSIFVYGILRHMDIPDLVAALLPGNIELEGLLDNVKNIISPELSARTFEKARKLCGLVGQGGELTIK